MWVKHLNIIFGGKIGYQNEDFNVGALKSHTFSYFDFTYVKFSMETLETEAK